MDILKPFLSPKKLRKLQNNPQAFFKDALDKRVIPIQNQLKALKPKKKYAFAEYYIISAVYNVEKYLDDYFRSILKQRLDFKNNIKIICVDDGSTDNSAKIIKNYQKRFPHNIVYLYKENGGQASARNLGIKWLQEQLGEVCDVEKKGKPIWVTFTDPDDFLDRDYFYEVDSFLEGNQDEEICMVGCNLIFYYEDKKAFRDAHPLKYKFKDRATIKQNKSLNGWIQLSVATAFLNFARIPTNLYFDEDLKPNFEDAKFVNEFLMSQMESQSAFLQNAKYFYRKRSDKSSTLDNVVEADLKQVLKMGYLLLLLLLAKKIFKTPPNFVQNTILYDLFWQIKATTDNPSKFSFHTPQERQEFFSLWDRIYALIETQVVLEFNLAGCWWYHKVGILNCFKNEYPPFQIAYIDAFDFKKEQVCIYYFTPDDKDVESIRVDGEEVYADYAKITQNDFLDRIFCYGKRLWVHIPQDSTKLEIFIRGQRARITFERKQYQSLETSLIRDKFKTLSKLASSNLWLFVDRDTEADDNAEHLYRYVAKNYPKQKIMFGLRKKSKCWERLKKEGFNLVAFGTQEFQKVLKSSSKVLSSHIDNYLLQHLGAKTMEGKDFVFLQHGVTKDDISSWLYSKSIRLFITTTKREYHSIVDNYNHYKFGLKEMRLTGFARHDTLLERNQKSRKVSVKQKQILLMPTWRKALSGEMIGLGNQRKYNPKFSQSEYFQVYQSLLQSDKLKSLCEKYDCKIIFNPHQNVMPYLKDFKLLDYIHLAQSDESLQNLFIESDLMITDYSSVAFEMAYLKKPVLYYQFDEKEFFKEQWQKGYFNYYTDGFGPVVTTEEDLLQELENLLKNDCKVGEPYASNIENTFEFRDGKCCERIYQEILELDKPYERKWTLDYVLNLAHNALNAKCYKEASERFRFVLEHLGDSEFADTKVLLNEEMIFNYLYASRMNQTSKEALEFIESQGYESKLALSNKAQFEIIKNYIEVLNAQEVIARLELLKNRIPQEELLEFAYLKLRIYAYLGDKQKLKEVYNELKNTYNIDKKDLDLDLFLFQNELIKAASLQSANTPAGGGGIL